MARLHADSVIRLSYVREVCRLLRASNINIVKSDVEFEENQIDLNREVKEKKQKEDNQNDLFVSTCFRVCLPKCILFTHRFRFQFYRD